MDIVYMLLVAAFFGLSTALLRLCESLGGHQ